MIYLFFLTLIPIFVKLLFKDKDVDSTPKKRFAYIFTCGTFIFIIMAFRSRYAGSPDTDTYCKLFDAVKELPSFTLVMESEEIGSTFFLFSEILFYFYVWILTRIFSHYQVLIIISSLITVLCVSNFIYKNSKNTMISLIAFIAFGLFTFSMNGMRQVLAMSICLLGYEFVKKRKFLPFLFTILIAALFHKSALFFIIIYFLPLLKYNYKTLILFAICFVLLVLFGNRIASIFGLMSGKDYASYVPTDTGGYMTVLIYVLSIALTFLYCSKQLKEDSWLRTLLFTCIIGFMLYISRYFISQAYERISYYFMYPSIILIPTAIESLDKENKKIYTVLVVTFALLLFAYRIQNASFKNFELILMNYGGSIL